ncbi:MAG TPA: acetyl-CoA carboxylase carboxyltransferase subunit alpha [Pyrinomonadaceae bacterium]|nr:acetyl-CoA carboxylase carboxyltransferase subunit alpha [Pyrinomonadaceae bacterium]HMP64911.1 acetyl-CoA carboxylase carboxyltransferase subunit alpha [Pyrinomonadaceae bacterium]
MTATIGTAFERVQNARHPLRPYSIDIFNTIFSDFVELHGDRRYADDSAMVCGFARLDGREVVVIGQQKGRDTKQRQQRNFGMPKPEGYRKALRIMKMAEKFGRPIITFIDTPGAYPGIDAEERGQAEAIAYNLREMAGLRVPIVVVVVGEGGSGGALAIGIGDRIIMLENAVYSVISPEGCAAILWKDSAEAPAAAEGLRLTADHLNSFGLIDEIIPEPESWAVAENEKDEGAETGGPVFEPVAKALSESLRRHLNELDKISGDDLRLARFKKFRKMGVWV